ALTSLVHTVTPPVSVTAKLRPVMPASAARISGARGLALRFGQVVHVAILGIDADRPGQHPGDIGPELVHRRHDHVACVLVVELLDALAEIGLDHLDADRGHVWRKPHSSVSIDLLLASDLAP